MASSIQRCFFVGIILGCIALPGFPAHAQPPEISITNYHPAIANDFSWCGNDFLSRPPEVTEKYRKEEEALQQHLAEVDQITDISRLTNLIFSAEDWHIQERAIEKLDDQKLLAALARETKDLSVRGMIIGRLGDPALLRHYAEDSNAFIRCAALRKITDQRLLAGVAMKDPDYSARQIATERLHDPDILEEMGYWVDPQRTRAITDPGLLEKLAAEASNILVRAAACQKVTNQTILVKAATESEAILRRSAIPGLTDQRLLAKFALSDRDGQVRKAAAAKITDATILAEKGMWLKPDLTRQVTNQVMLKRIIMESRDREVRRAAISKLEDRSLLQVIALKDPDDLARREAGMKTSNQSPISP